MELMELYVHWPQESSIASSMYSISVINYIATPLLALGLDDFSYQEQLAFSASSLMCMVLLQMFFCTHIYTQTHTYVHTDC